MSVNLVAVVVGAISTMVVGYVWYSKMLFGAQWLKFSGLKESDITKGAGMAYSLMFVVALVMAYVLDWFLIATGKTGWMEGAKLGLIASIGFTATAFASEFIFNKRSLQFYLITAGFQVVAITIVGAILGMMG